MPCFASQVKVDWSVHPSDLLDHAEQVAETATSRLEADGLAENSDLPLFDVDDGKIKILTATRPAQFRWFALGW